MTRDEILQMAEQVGFGRLLTGDNLPTMWCGLDIVMIETFAHLVADREREACAKECENAFVIDNNFTKHDYAAIIRARGSK